MQEERIIHIQWEGPCQFAEAKQLQKSDDYGVYQIYGGHPIHGMSALLYIGRAMEQRFGVRIPQERGWQQNRDADRVEVYVGRLSGYDGTPDAVSWNTDIKLAERLLIWAHAPPANSQKALGDLDGKLFNVHVLNWGNYRELLPEVSGARWTSRFRSSSGYGAFNLDEMSKP